MKFIVGGGGWYTDSKFFAPGTIIDDGLTQASRQSVIPMDATAFDQVTYDYMTSNGFPGLGYPYWAVKAMAGVRVIDPPIGQLFVPGSGMVLGGGGVLG